MVKVISLSDVAYTELRSIKGERSFSETILTLLHELKKGTDYATFGKLAGAFKEDKGSWELVKKEIAENRKQRKVRA